MHTLSHTHQSLITAQLLLLLLAGRFLWERYAIYLYLRWALLPGINIPLDSHAIFNHMFTPYHAHNTTNTLSRHGPWSCLWQFRWCAVRHYHHRTKPLIHLHMAPRNLPSPNFTPPSNHMYWHTLSHTHNIHPSFPGATPVVLPGLSPGTGMALPHQRNHNPGIG